MSENLSSNFNARIFFLGLMFFLLTACSTEHDKQKNLSLMVNQRAMEITSELPIQKENFTFVLARPLPPATLELVVYSDAHNSEEIEKIFLHRFASALCKNSKSRTLLQYGAKYQVRLRHSDNQENTQVIQYASCSNV